MSEKLSRLKAIRGGHRSVVTKHEKEATTIIANEILTKHDVSRIQVIHCLLEEKLKTLNTIDQDVLTLCSEGEVEKEIEDSEAIIARAMGVNNAITDKIKQYITDKIKQYEQRQEPSQVSAGESIISQISMHNMAATGVTSGVESKTAKPKLPKLNLPKFKGDVTSFTTFWEIFESAIDKNEGLSDIDKFHYLHSLLEGPASRAIQGLALTSANYKTSIEILKQRFGRPQQIISSHMDELLKVPICSDDKASSMRLVYDRINTNIRGLESLGIKSDQYGSLLIPIIMSKLPSETRLIIARNSEYDVWKIDDLMKTILSEVEAREISERVKTTNERKPNFPNNRGPNQHRNNNPGTAAALYSGDNTYNSIKIRCAYCHEFHFSASCEKIKDLKQRKEILRKGGRCFVCLRIGHKGSECQKTCRRCNGKHHQSICMKSADESASNQESREQENSKKDQTREGNKESRKPNTTDKDAESAKEVKTTTTTDQRRSSVLLQTATAYAYNSANSNRTKIRMLFDSGSQRSYITNELKEKLDLKPTKQETLHLNTFGEEGFKRQKCDMFSLQLQGEDGELDIELSALAFPVICSPVSTRINIQEFPHLDGLQFADNLDGGDQSIDMLLGADYYYKIVTGEVIKGDTGPTAVGSKLGWLLLGPTSTTTSSYTMSHLVIDGRREMLFEEKGNDELVSNLKRFWDLESLGIVQKNESTASTDILRDITFNGKRYEVGLPWKEEVPSLCNDYELSYNRLTSLVNRLKQTPILLKEYNAIIEEQIEQGIVERVPVEREGNSETHYIPHHGVIRNDRDTTKLRIVFDGSAKEGNNEQSLNDHLLNGPNFMPLIFDVLVKFGAHAIGLTADIEKAFLQIEIKESDRDKLRFLWFKDPNSKELKVQQLRFCRLVFGLKPSPSILGGTVLHHISKYQETEPEIVEVLKDLYVDDFPTGAPDEETAFEIYQKSKRIMKEGGFNLRKWKSSSKELSERINECERVNEVTTVLKLVAKIFDPLGLLSAFTIKLKMMFQSLCKDKTDWDKELRGEMRVLYDALVNELTQLSGVSVPRCYFSRRSKAREHQLHGFSDASEKAYAAVVYLRTKYDDEHVDVNLVASKTRVAPIKQQTIPRLELLGATILARLVESISSSLMPTLGKLEKFYWVDSSAVLCWVKNNKLWKQFVQHRIQEIRRSSSKDAWRFCPGSKNPADLPSRGASGTDLKSNEAWWKGPEFLQRPEEEWPNDLACENTDPIAMAEVTKHKTDIVHSLANQAKPLNSDISTVIDCARFSTKTRLLRTTAYVLRFVKVLRKEKTRREEVTERENAETGERGRSFELSTLELRQAEELWIQAVQKNSFEEELKFLSSNKVSTPPTYVAQFGLYVDEQSLIRCAGRIKNAHLPNSSKCPVLLPKNHHFTNLVIQEVHHRMKHVGINQTLSSLREQFWVIRGREIVKRTFEDV